MAMPGANVGQHAEVDDHDTSLSLSSPAGSRRELALDIRHLASALQDSPEAHGQPKALFQQPACKIGIGGSLSKSVEAAVDPLGESNASASQSRKVHPDRVCAAVAQLQGQRESDKRRLLSLEQRLELQLQGGVPPAALTRLAEAQGGLTALSEEVQALRHRLEAVDARMSEVRLLAQKSQQTLSTMDSLQVQAMEHRYKLAATASEEVQRRQAAKLRRTEQAVEEMLQRIEVVEESLRSGAHSQGGERQVDGGCARLEVRLETLEKRQEEAEGLLEALQVQADNLNEGVGQQASEAAERSIALLDRRTAGHHQEMSSSLANLRVKVDGQIQRVDAIADRLAVAHEPALELLRDEFARARAQDQHRLDAELSSLRSELQGVAQESEETLSEVREALRLVREDVVALQTPQVPMCPGPPWHEDGEEALVSGSEPGEGLQHADPEDVHLEQELHSLSEQLHVADQLAARAAACEREVAVRSQAVSARVTSAPTTPQTRLGLPAQPQAALSDAAPARCHGSGSSTMMPDANEIFILAQEVSKLQAHLLASQLDLHTAQEATHVDTTLELTRLASRLSEAESAFWPEPAVVTGSNTLPPSDDEGLALALPAQAPSTADSRRAEWTALAERLEPLEDVFRALADKLGGLQNGLELSGVQVASLDSSASFSESGILAACLTQGTWQDPAADSGSFAESRAKELRPGAGLEASVQALALRLAADGPVPSAASGALSDRGRRRHLGGGAAARAEADMAFRALAARVWGCQEQDMSALREDVSQVRGTLYQLEAQVDSTVRRLAAVEELCDIGELVIENGAPGEHELLQRAAESHSSAVHSTTAPPPISPLVMARGKLDTLCEQVVELQAKMHDSADRSLPSTPLQSTPQRRSMGQFAEEFEETDQ